MSIETHVFFRGPLPRKAALQRAMRELGFPFFLKPDTGSLEDQRGFMPMTLRRDDTGVEFDVFDGRETIDELAGDDDVDPAFDRCANFRWGGDETEMLAGLCAAAALAKLVGGVVCDEAEDRLLSVDEAVAVAKRYVDALPKPDAPKHPGTRPADIKRYLKPLLKLRPDLVLRGRHLLIRPVRHVLRGAILDRTSDKYEFRLFRYLNPLYGEADAGGFGGTVYDMVWKVWQPYFLPLLFDTLAEDVFDRVGPVTTLAGLADWMIERKRHNTALIRALVLAGDRDRAVSLMDEIEREEAADPFGNMAWVRNQRALLARDIASICEEAHRDEAATAKALKLGDAWEPSPFPVELPVAARCTVDEPSFTTTPWMPKTDGLIVELPNEPGDVRFAQKSLGRDGRIVLLAPLTREETEKKHADRENYVLCTRTTEGQLILLVHHTGWSPHDFEQPNNPNYVARRDYYLWIYGTMGRLRAEFGENWENYDDFRMKSVSIQDGKAEIWYSFNDFRENRIRVFPKGSDGRIHAITQEEASICKFEQPGFGDVQEYLQRTLNYLSAEGFGHFL